MFGVLRWCTTKYRIQGKFLLAGVEEARLVLPVSTHALEELFPALQFLQAKPGLTLELGAICRVPIHQFQQMLCLGS